MDLGVTLSATGQERHLPTVAVGHPSVPLERTELALDSLARGVEVHLVTLQTEERLVLLQEVIRDGSVGTMTDQAVLHDRRMLEDERALLVRVTLETEIRRPVTDAPNYVAAAVMIV